MFMLRSSAAARLHDRPPSVYLPEPARILEVREMTRMEKWFRLAMLNGRPLGHMPGQFVEVSLVGIGECPISICSSPTQPAGFELCIRKVGTVTSALHELRSGDIVGIRGPHGHGFDMNELHGKDIVVVVGGLGAAPARSLIQYILDERERFGAFHLMYGARHPSELLFREDISRWTADPNVQFHLTVDRADEGWRGKVGVVTTLFKYLPTLDPNNTMVVIIGPPVMFKFVVLEVLARRIPQNHVYCSLERRMKCGIGKCGHCQANHVYCCLDGPVFKYGQLKALREAIE